jgi:hypothetical protein
LQFVSFEVWSQVTISGAVVSSKTGEPLPSAAVFCASNQKYGTITDAKGKFLFAIPSNCGDFLKISFVGFSTRTVKISKLKPGVLIRLDENETLLKEVIVTYDDTLKRMLVKAYGLIEQNYPTEPMMIDGIYRETNFIVEKNQFVYFSESLLQFYDPGYQSRALGFAKILEGGKIEANDRTSLSNVYFFGGPYAPQRSNFVHQVYEFIDPRKFNLYNYQIAAVIGTGNDVYYRIKFTPGKNASYDGYFYLHKATLAYSSAEFRLTQVAIQKWQNRRLLKGVDIESREFKIDYKVRDGKWTLNSVAIKGDYRLKENSHLKLALEYVSTHVRPTTKNLIKESEALPLSAIYTLQTNKFDNKFLEKSGALSPPTRLDSTVVLQFKMSDKGLLSVKSPESKRSYREKMVTIASKISSGIFIGSAPLSNSTQHYQLAYKNLLSVDRTVTETAAVPAISYNMRYYASDFFCVSFRSLRSLAKRNKMDNFSFGIEYNQRLFGWRHAFYIQPGLSVFYSSNRLLLGDVSPTSYFTVNRRRFNSEKVQVSVGEIMTGFMPSLSFNYKISGRIGFSIELLTTFSSSRRQKIFLTETSRFFSSTASIGLTDGDVLLERNGSSAEIGSTIKNGSLFGIFGFRFGLK